MARRKKNGDGDGATAVVDNPNGDSPATDTGQEKRQPFKKIRMRNITAAIWQNVNDRGTWYSVTITRSYRDEQNNWHTTESFSGPDLLIVAEVARAAFAWIIDVTQNPSPQPSPNGNGGSVPDSGIPF